MTRQRIAVTTLAARAVPPPPESTGADTSGRNGSWLRSGHDEARLIGSGMPRPDSPPPPYSPSRLRWTFSRPASSAQRSSSTDASSSTIGTAKPSTRRSIALRYVLQTWHSSTPHL